MTDADLIAKKLSFIETCLTQLRTYGNAAAIFDDIVQQRFVEHTLQLAIQAALDVASHIVADDRLGEPKTNAELFLLLQRAKIIGATLAESLRRMAGFRNILVHGYDDVDLSVVVDAMSSRLGDLDAFVQAIRSRL